MTREEYEWQVKLLKDKIEKMMRIKCPRVAAKYERMLKDLEKKYPQFSELCLQQEN